MAQSLDVLWQSSHAKGKDISPNSEQRFVSPHPNPLPRGEGTASFVPWKANNGGLFYGQRTVHPLPGERAGVGAKHVTRVARSRNCRTLRVLRQSRRFPIRIMMAPRSSFPFENRCGVAQASRLFHQSTRRTEWE